MPPPDLTEQDLQRMEQFSKWPEGDVPIGDQLCLLCNDIAKLLAAYRTLLARQGKLEQLVVPMKELRDMAAAMGRILVRHGLTHELPTGHDGFGKRADNALAEVEEP